MFGYGNGMGGWGHMSGWGYAFMGLSSLLLSTALIFGGIMLFHHLSRSTNRGSEGPPRSTPEQLLAERFARGDIDDEQYKRGLDTLHGIRAPG